MDRYVGCVGFGNIISTIFAKLACLLLAWRKFVVGIVNLNYLAKSNDPGARLHLFFTSKHSNNETFDLVFCQLQNPLGSWKFLTECRKPPWQHSLGAVLMSAPVPIPGPRNCKKQCKKLGLWSLKATNITPFQGSCNTPWAHPTQSPYKLWNESLYY